MNAYKFFCREANFRCNYISVRGYSLHWINGIRRELIKDSASIGMRMGVVLLWVFPNWVTGIASQGYRGYSYYLAHFGRGREESTLVSYVKQNTRQKNQINHLVYAIWNALCITYDNSSPDRCFLDVAQHGSSLWNRYVGHLHDSKCILKILGGIVDHKHRKVGRITGFDVKNLPEQDYWSSNIMVN